jgi:hypothetical protein
MTKYLSLAAVLAVALSPTMARAEDEKKKKKADAPDLTAVFAKLDANSDKKVSENEFAAFKGLATPKPTKDGKEPKKIAGQRAEWFKTLDTNGDKTLSGEEFAKVKDVVAAAKKKKQEEK